MITPIIFCLLVILLVTIYFNWKNRAKYKIVEIQLHSKEEKFLPMYRKGFNWLPITTYNKESSSPFYELGYQTPSSPGAKYYYLSTYAEARSYIEGYHAQITPYFILRETKVKP